MSIKTQLNDIENLLIQAETAAEELKDYCEDIEDDFHDDAEELYYELSNILGFAQEVNSRKSQ